MGWGSLRETLIQEISGPARFDPGSLEIIAEHVIAVRTDDTFDGLAAGQGVQLRRVMDLPSGVRGLAMDMLWVQRAREPGEERLVSAHELSHEILAPLEHTHADVWMLALALLAPRAVTSANPTPARLARACGIPRWAAVRRVLMRQLASAENLRVARRSRSIITTGIDGGGVR